MRAIYPYIILIIACLFIMYPVQSQDDEQPPNITAENITQLQSVATVDFPEDVNSGWFILSETARRIGVVHQSGGLYIFGLNGEVVGRSSEAIDEDISATVIDAVFYEDNIAILLRGADDYSIALYQGDDESTFELPVEQDMPVRLWMDDESLWVEVLSLESDHYVMQINIENGKVVNTLLSGPENDETAFVRIGRIDAPLAITSTIEGLTKLWDLETGEVTAEIQLEIPPVFGRIDETNGTNLAWRDPASENLYMLNFETGENQQVAPLFGEYIQAFTLTPEADVIIAVGIEDEPVVVAWDVATGERYDLGEYRECSRVPDMVRLSVDGTTLVIGCDTGLDIWRVVES